MAQYVERVRRRRTVPVCRSGEMGRSGFGCESDDAAGHSEADAVLAAWLATQLLTLPAPLPADGDEEHGVDPTPGARPTLGRWAERITHVLIDEAQDLSPAHCATVRAAAHVK